MTWLRHTDMPAAWHNSITRADGARIHADVWPVEGGFMWMTSTDGREDTRSRRAVATLLEAKRRAIKGMMRLEKLYNSRGFPPKKEAT